MVACHITVGWARVVVRTLWSECHCASHFSVGPNFAFKRLDLENFILEEHFVLFNCFSDGSVLASKCCNGSLLFAFFLSSQLCVVVGVIRIHAAIVIIFVSIFYGSFNLLPLLLLLLTELEIKSLLSCLLLYLIDKGSPREFYWDSRLVHNLEVLVGEECD